MNTEELDSARERITELSLLPAIEGSFSPPDVATQDLALLIISVLPLDTRPSIYGADGGYIRLEWFSDETLCEVEIAATRLDRD